MIFRQLLIDFYCFNIDLSGSFRGDGTVAIDIDCDVILLVFQIKSDTSNRYLTT